MADDDPMDVPRVIETLSEALRLQWRSVVLYGTAAATATGLDGAALAHPLRKHALAEAADAVRLAEKLVAVGGTPPTDVPSAELPSGGTSALERLATAEEETIAALHGVIEHSGQEPRSEALEHILEHVIMRKQQQVDFLRRALG